MTRNLKVLGLALVAAFAMSAVVASAASAQIGKITSDGPVTLKGTETGGVGANSFTAFGATVECPGSTYTGHKVITTPHTLIPSGSTEATITPKYVNCVTGGNPATIDMNGCDYVFRDATTVSAGTWGVTVDIVCPVGQVIKITGGACTVEVPAQTGKTGFHLSNTPANASTKDDIDLTLTISTLTAHTCLGLKTNSAVQHIDVTIKGFNSLGEETGVTISD